MRDKVLIVDDMPMNRELLSEILEDEYFILEAENGREAIELLETRNSEIAIVLLDLIMPVMDGIAVLKEMQNHKWIDEIPVLVISSENSVNVERECFDYGVSDFIRKPFAFPVVKKRVENMVALYLHKNRLEETVEKQTQALREQYKLLKKRGEELERSNVRIIDILATVVEYRNLESGEHVKRVKGFTRILAWHLMKEYPEYGLDEKQVERISSASALHDVGKIAIPDAILLKPGKLTADEFECMKTHTLKGCDILNNITDVWDDEYGKFCYEICRSHHEKYDGKGYPDGLAGEEIPISAQIVSIADVYDALVSERVYKSAYTPNEAFNMILAGECGVFSPKLLECFKKSQKEFEELVMAYKG